MSGFMIAECAMWTMQPVVHPIYWQTISIYTPDLVCTSGALQRFDKLCEINKVSILSEDYKDVDATPLQCVALISKSGPAERITHTNNQALSPT